MSTNRALAQSHRRCGPIGPLSELSMETPEDDAIEQHTELVPEEAVAEIKQRYGGVVTRMTLFAGDDEGVAMVEALRGASGSGAGAGTRS